MPLPKGINTAAVRQAWLAERRARVEEFDRLVGKGMSECKVARALGTSRTGIQAMRQSIEHLEAGYKYGRAGNASIDLGLALLSCLRKPGEMLTARDIAAWCGCTHAAIQSIERRALTKLRQRLVEEARTLELADEVESLLAGLAEAA